MSDELNEQAQIVREPAPVDPSQRARIDLRLIGLIFLLPLVLMLVTSLVCIAVIVARH